ncbi:MAG: arsenosugar biosynthesis radical SAM protein ArsS [Nitrospinae bacterium]|nr:arsenosugar biosynthesis radical SAM protein ArsS [Nitrospinota bacterium]
MPAHISLPLSSNGAANFIDRIREDAPLLDRTELSTLQINVGKYCNQTCAHCHVGAGPHRKEIMTEETANRIIEWLEDTQIPNVDITGGAPELNAQFRRIVTHARRKGRHVMVRCNLTVVYEPGQEDLIDFYRENRVELICSLPCYLEENVNAQRGDGVFEKSIRALRDLNEAGFGPPGELELNLVYNPVDDNLPPPQEALEADYKRELLKRYGIRFHHLYTITNMPITRFASYLKVNGKLDSYMATLREAYNPETLPGLMCRNLISVGWDGVLYDCDFNQMLDMSLGNGTPLKLWDVAPADLLGREILLGDHCFGCTAGAGSSCGGSLA